MEKYYKKTFTLQITIAVAIMILSVLELTTSYLNIALTDSAINANLDGFIFYTVLCFLAMGLITLLSFFTNKLLATGQRRVTVLIREDYLSQYINSYDVSKKNDTGGIINKLTSDIDYVMYYGYNTRFELLKSIFSCFFALVGAATIHISFLIIFPITAIISTLAVQSLTPIIQNTATQQSEEKEKYISKINNIFTGFNVLAMYNVLNNFKAQINTSGRELEAKKEKHNTKNAWVNALINLSMVFSQLVFIIVAGYLVVGQHIIPGAIVGLITMSSMFFGGVQKMMSLSVSINSAKPILKKIFENLSLSKIEKVKISKIKNEIKIKSLSFNYPNEKEDNLLSYKDEAFEIGKKYLIKGASGSGKSTLVQLICGQLQEYTGEIYFDEYNIKELDRSVFSDIFAYIKQDVYIFNDTIKNNITLKNEISQAAYEYAAQKSGLMEYINSKQEKSDYILNPSGDNLSGGQKQRIAIARALVYNKEILVVDEGLKGLDKELSDEIEKQLLSISGKTIIMISHKSDKAIENLYDKIIEVSL